ncbi:hypothetical protein WA588_006327, partial [Blastocystis sp. NMH]
MSTHRHHHHYCYLLRSLNPSHPNSVYIGYTVNPKKRIRQHNREITNGAFKTHRAMPWEMIVVVFGFPTHREGLSFEWAWQHPTKSTTSRKYITKQMQNRRSYLPKIEIALRMLTHSPWKEMQLGMLITNCQVYSTAIDKFADLVSQVHLLNQPLQYLYDEQTTNESADEENEVESLFINP